MNPISTVSNILKGVKVAIDMATEDPVTTQYPEIRKRVPLHDSSKAIHALAVKKDGETACVACKTCENTCPAEAIEVKCKIDQNSNTVLDDYILDSSKCILCGLCVKACPKNAIIRIPWRDNLSKDDAADLKFDRKQLEDHFKKNKMNGIG